MTEFATAAEYNLDGAQQLAQVWAEEGGPDFQPDFPRIKVPAGGGTTWEDPEDPNFEPRRELRGVIVGFRTATQLYLESFEGSDDGSKRPDAWSTDGIVQVVPQETYEKINALNAANGWQLPYPSKNLADCPFNKFPGKDGGVVIPGRNTTAPVNSSYRELFMVLHGSPAPIPYQVRISAASIPAWDARGKGYKNKLLTRGIRLSSVETVLTLTPEKGPGNVTYSKVAFNPGRALDPALLGQTAEFTQGLKSFISSDPFAVSRGAAQPVIEAAPVAALPAPAVVNNFVPAAPVAEIPAPAPAVAHAHAGPVSAELDQAFSNAVGAPDPGIAALQNAFDAAPVASTPVAQAAPAPAPVAPAPVAQAAPAPAPVAAAVAPAPAAAPVALPVPVPVQEPVAAAPAAAPVQAVPVGVAVGSGAPEDDIDF